MKTLSTGVTKKVIPTRSKDTEMMRITRAAKNADKGQPTSRLQGVGDEVAYGNKPNLVLKPGKRLTATDSDIQHIYKDHVNQTLCEQLDMLSMSIHVQCAFPCITS